MMAVTRVWHRTIAVGVWAMALSGCVSPAATKPDRAQGEAQAVLAAARANRINLFGDLGDATDLPYFTRSAVSLRQHTFADAGGDSDPDIDAPVTFVYPS